MTWKNYIWDFDGTLFDTYPVMMQALEKALEECSVKFEGDLARYVKMFSIRKFSQEFADGEHFSDVYHQIEHEMQKKPPVYPEIPQILQEIVVNGGRNFVLSHRDDTTFEHLGELEPLFTEVITSEQSFARKPSPEAINYLIDKYALIKSETVMIGDRPLDIEAGKNAGVATLLLDEYDYFGEIADKKIKNWSEWK